MKTSHVIFFLILFLILRNKATTQPAPAATVSTGGDTTVRDTTVRRDMDEKYALLLERIEELENSAYA
jgi:hypothetical protein